MCHAVWDRCVLASKSKERDIMGTLSSQQSTGTGYAESEEGAISVASLPSAQLPVRQAHSMQRARHLQTSIHPYNNLLDSAHVPPQLCQWQAQLGLVPQGQRIGV
jgi:hypothetical protein